MKIPLSEAEYKALELVAKREGLDTVDQAAQLAVLEYLVKWDPSILAELKDRIDPKVLKAFQKS